MYFTSRDTQQYILNNKAIIQQVVVEWNRKPNKKLTKNKNVRRNAAMGCG